MAGRKRSQEGGVVVLSTVAKPGQARRLARTLLEERLCGCVSIVPAIRSLYWWKDRIEGSSELLLLVKTTRGKLGALRRRLEELHPYDVPELLTLTPSSIAPAYARWLAASVRHRT